MHTYDHPKMKIAMTLLLIVTSSTVSIMSQTTRLLVRADDMETRGMEHVGYENVVEDRDGVTYALPTKPSNH